MDICCLYEVGEDCGVWGTRTDTEDSLQNIKFDSERSELMIDLILILKRYYLLQENAFSLFRDSTAVTLCLAQVDTVIMTGDQLQAVLELPL